MLGATLFKAPAVYLGPFAGAEAFRSPSSSFLQSHKGPSLRPATVQFPSHLRRDGLFQQKRRGGFCSLSAKAMDAGRWGEESKLLLHRTLESLMNHSEALPQPVKSFPWNRVVRSFVRIIFELVVAVAKYLCLPLLAVSSLSEMSYCAHERKMSFIPVPFLVGMAIASVLKETAVDLSPDLKEGEFPWHLLSMAVFFTLLKLPGPYYPYFARLIVPHFANGALWSTVWFTFQWYRNAQGKLQSRGLSESK